MRANLRYDDGLKTFLIDQEIEDAYQVLKPVMDAIHERFITESLSSSDARSLDVSKYYAVYKSEDAAREKELEKSEKELRGTISGFFSVTADEWKAEHSEFKEKGYKILTEKGVLDYIKKEAGSFGSIASENDIHKALEHFQDFFTYFSGFNTNRENYYTTEKEAKTAVATRIVHENLPKFCDNVIAFESHRAEYLGIFAQLQEAGRSLVMKDETPLVPIDGALFDPKDFGVYITQAGIERYNSQIGNANFLINLHNQRGGARLPLMKTLYKQIGCGTKDALFFEISCDKDAEKGTHSLQEVLSDFASAGERYFSKQQNSTGEIETVEMFSRYVLFRENYRGVYWSKQAMNTISAKYLANWYELQEELLKAKVFKKGKSEGDEAVIVPEVVPVDALFDVLDHLEDWRTPGVFFKESLTLKIEDPKSESDHLRNRRADQCANIIANSQIPSRALLGIIFWDMEDHAQKFLLGSRAVLELSSYHEGKDKEKIKEWMDHALAVLHILKYFSVRESKVKGHPLDATIVEAIKLILNTDEVGWFKWYDATRNYLTKKVEDDVAKNTLRLNFENPNLLGGWSDGQEKSKASVVLKNEGKYYLGILAPKNRSIFDTKRESNPVYEGQLNGSRLVLMKLSFQTLAGKGFLGEFGESYGNMGKRVPMEAVHNLQKIIRDRYEKKYPLLKRIADSTYENKRLFDDDIKKTLEECYVCEFHPVNWNEVLSFVNDGKMYLFEVRVKDFAPGIKGKKNLHTLYWDSVFSKESSFQLSAGGKIFYRRRILNEEKIKAKYDNEDLELGYRRKNHIIENKRYTKEKFIFHCAIKMNFREIPGLREGKPNPLVIKNLHSFVNEELIKKDQVNFIGIDRGEKHLAYYFVIDKDGNRIDDGSLNQIGATDYNVLLTKSAGKRDDARKNWQTIGNIKDLKDGYISHVVRRIVDLAIKHNAVIVLENLSVGFKRGRQKIEKSVYQKLELALAQKLNFLVDKDAPEGTDGSPSRALQLTPPVQNFGDIDKRAQVGIMFYTRADYTSQTDPVTGWRKTIYLKSGSEEYIKKQILEQFTDIVFEDKDYCFSYVDKATGKEWKMYSGKNGASLDRFVRKMHGGDKGWKSTRCDAVEDLGKLFKNFDHSSSLLEQMKSGRTELEKIDPKRTAWESLRFAIGLIQQIRNAGTSVEDEDFILSPVRDAHGVHFDSRHASDGLPVSGDANGAFNIARKGMIMAEHVKRGYGLYVADDEWSAWLAGRDVWEGYCAKNAEKLKKKNKKMSIDK